MRSQLYALGAQIGVCLLASPAPTIAAPLAGATSKNLLTQASGNSLVVQVQRRRGRASGGFRGGRGYRGGGGGYGYGYGGNGGAAAAGFLGGLFLGAIIANEAQHNQGVDYCIHRYRSYDPNSMTYLGYDGRCHSCP